MKQIRDFTIVNNRCETHDFVVLTLNCEDELPQMQPGQFVEVKVDDTPSAYLRRPLSIHDVDYSKREIKLLVQEVGAGTRSICAMPVGSKINLVFPLGKGYDLPDSKDVLLVGGGCGVAPLLFLGRFLSQNGIRPRFLIGARTASSLVRLDAYRELGEVLVTTEDGSEGQKGFRHPSSCNAHRITRFCLDLYLWSGCYDACIG
jgi:dihydroorotate dehydrogenase electron transfer subunit